MSEGSISQEEIDALLSGVDVSGLGHNSFMSAGANADIDIPTLQSFAETIKDSFAEVLKNMTQKAATVGKPAVEKVGRDQLLAKLPEDVIAVTADYTAGLGGEHLFIISPEFATKLVSLINQEENPTLDEMGLSVVSEVISSHSGAEITELNKSGKLPGLATNPPQAQKQPKAMVRMPEGTFACFTYPVTLDGEAYTLWEAVSSSVADGMAKALGGGVKPAARSAPAAAAGNQNAAAGMAGGAQPMGGMQMPPPNVQPLQFSNFTQNLNSTEQGNISLIMDVFMEMTVELGRTRKTIKDILGLGEGSIIELDKLAGEPVDILVNRKPIAKGEVVVIDENFGVRVTEILPSLEHVATSV